MNPQPITPGMIARASQQTTLGFAIPPRFKLGPNAHARNAYGNAAQYLTCACLDLLPIAIDGSKRVCFDAEKNGEFYEIKSVHRTSKVVVYDWRLDKEAAAAVPLWYAIFAHRIKGIKESDALWSALQAGPIEIYRVRFVTIRRLSKLCDLRKMNTINHGLCKNGRPFGYDRAGYVEGYRNIPMNWIAGECAAVGPRQFSFEGMLFNATVFEEKTEKTCKRRKKR